MTKLNYLENRIRAIEERLKIHRYCKRRGCGHSEDMHEIRDDGSCSGDSGCCNCAGFKE